MKGFLVIFLILVNSAIGFGQTAEFFVMENTHRFPKTKEGVQLKHTFEVINTGKAPLVITKYEVNCSCTKVTLPEPIPPGKTGNIVVEFDTNGKYYQQDRTIILHTNTKRKMETLRFKVFVKPSEE